MNLPVHTRSRAWRDFPQSTLLVCVVVLVGTFAIYMPCMSGGLIWDDNYLVGDNPFFKSPVFIFEVFRHHLFLDAFSAYYRPLQNVSYILDYWIWNQNTFGYHLGNALYHGASGCLLYLLLRRLLPSLVEGPATLDGGTRASPEAVPVLAFLVAFVWVVHPVHNAAVAYISGRADSLAALLCLGAWLVKLKADAASSRFARLFGFGGAAMLCLLALTAKEIAIVWIALFSFHLFCFSGEKSVARKLWTFATLGLLIAIYWGLRHLPPPLTPPTGDTSDPFAARVLLMLRALGDYARLLVFPRLLHMERAVYLDNLYLAPGGWHRGIGLEYLSLLGAAVLFGGWRMCAQRGPARRLRLFGAGWFCIGFLPISNLFPLNAQVAEHWIYMPSIGFLLFVAGCVWQLPAPWRVAASWFVLVFAGALAARTAVRSSDWLDAATFYARTIEDGGGTPRVHLNLASAYQDQGKLEEAEKILRRTVSRYPGYTTARIGLGRNLLKQGRTAEAEEFLAYDKAAADLMAKQFSYTWTAAFNLAHARLGEKRIEEAAAIVEEAMVRFPNNFELTRLNARLVQQTRGPAAAIPGMQAHADRFWWHYETFMVLGRLRFQNNDLDGAVAAFQHAGRLDIHAGEPFDLVARVEMARGRKAQALAAEKKAISRDPDKPSQLLFLAAILEALDRKAEAEAAVAKAGGLRTTIAPKTEEL